MNKLKTILVSLTIATTVVVGVAPPVAVSASIQPCDEVSGSNAGSFFGFPTWYKYLSCEDNGSPVLDRDQPEQLWLIAAAVFEMITRVAGIIAIAMIIWGGFLYITSVGSPDKTKKARETIIYALAGMVLAIMATAVVNIIVNTLTGGTGTPGSVAADQSVIANVLKLVYAVAGSVAVIAIVIGGIKFATSTGDPQGINSARNTIIYAVIGLLVVLFASVITTYVVGLL